jgi:hypothetical protein
MGEKMSTIVLIVITLAFTAFLTTHWRSIVVIAVFGASFWFSLIHNPFNDRQAQAITFVIIPICLVVFMVSKMLPRSLSGRDSRKLKK